MRCFQYALSYIHKRAIIGPSRLGAYVFDGTHLPRLLYKDLCQLPDLSRSKCRVLKLFRYCSVFFEYSTQTNHDASLDQTSTIS